MPRPLSEQNTLCKVAFVPHWKNCPETGHFQCGVRAFKAKRDAEGKATDEYVLGETVEEYERHYNGEAVQKCAECEWCKDVEDSIGRTIYFCMNADGGAHLEETGLMGWRTVPAEDEESDFY